MCSNKGCGCEEKCNSCGGNFTYVRFASDSSGSNISLDRNANGIERCFQAIITSSESLDEASPLFGGLFSGKWVDICKDDSKDSCCCIEFDYPLEGEQNNEYLFDGNNTQLLNEPNKINSLRFQNNADGNYYTLPDLVDNNSLDLSDNVNYTFDFDFDFSNLSNGETVKISLGDGAGATVLTFDNNAGAGNSKILLTAQGGSNFPANSLIFLIEKSGGGNIANFNISNFRLSNDKCVQGRTSDLINDGENGTDPFITANEIPDVPEYTLSPISGTNTVDLIKDGVSVSQIDLTPYLDDTNLARIVSGVVDGNTGIATITRDDGSTFTMDFSSFLDPRVPFTVFIDTVNGDDTTGQIENKNRPFQTDTAAYNALPTDDGTTWTLFYIDTGSIVRTMNELFPARRIRIKSVSNGGSFDFSGLSGINNAPPYLELDFPNIDFRHQGTTQSIFGANNGQFILVCRDIYHDTPYGGLSGFGGFYRGTTGSNGADTNLIKCRNFFNNQGGQILGFNGDFVVTNTLTLPSTGSFTGNSADIIRFDVKTISKAGTGAYRLIGGNGSSGSLKVQRILGTGSLFLQDNYARTMIYNFSDLEVDTNLSTFRLASGVDNGADITIRGTLKDNGVALDLNGSNSMNLTIENFNGRVSRIYANVLVNLRMFNSLVKVTDEFINQFDPSSNSSLNNIQSVSLEGINVIIQDNPGDLIINENTSLTIDKLGSIKTNMINIGNNVIINNVTPNYPKLDVCDFNGIPQISLGDIDKIRLKGGTFTPSLNLWSVDPLGVNTYYLKLDGDDTTGEFENSNRPYRTLDAILDLFQGQTQSNNVAITIHILDSGTYQLTKQIQQVFNLRFYSEFGCTIDFSNFDFANAPVQNSNIIFINNQSVTPYLTFDIPNGKIRNLTSTPLRWGGEDYVTTLNVGSIENLSASQMFYCRHLRLRAQLNYEGVSPLYFAFGGGNIDNLIFGTYRLNGIAQPNSNMFPNCKKVTINNLVLNDVDNSLRIFQGLPHLVVGNVSGTNSNFRFWYHTGKTKVEFNNSVISIPMIFTQSLGNVTFTGIIESLVSIGGTIFVSTATNEDNLILENLVIRSIGSGQFSLTGDARLQIRNCVIESPSTPIIINKGSNCKILGLTNLQNTPNVLVNVTDGVSITAYGLDGNYTTIQ